MWCSFERSGRPEFRKDCVVETDGVVVAGDVAEVRDGVQISRPAQVRVEHEGVVTGSTDQYVVAILQHINPGELGGRGLRLDCSNFAVEPAQFLRGLAFVVAGQPNTCIVELQVANVIPG